MWRRKNKDAAEQGRDPARRVQRSGGPGPAFSYYTNSRGVEATRQAERPDQAAGAERVRRPLASRMSFWLLLALAVVCALKLLWLSASPRVVVVGRTSTSNIYLQSTDVYATAAQRLLAGGIANRLKLTADLNGTAVALERQFPELQAVSLTVPLVSNRPIVYIQPAQPSAVLQTGGRNYALNKSGVVLARLQTVPANIPLIVDASNASAQPGRQFLPGSTVAFVQTVEYQLTAAHLAVTAFTLPQASPYELQAHLEGQSCYLRFNLAADALTQSGAVLATIQKLGGSVPHDYLDVRVPGRVYYK